METITAERFCCYAAVMADIQGLFASYVGDDIELVGKDTAEGEALLLIGIPRATLLYGARPNLKCFFVLGASYPLEAPYMLVPTPPGYRIREGVTWEGLTTVADCRSSVVLASARVVLDTYVHELHMRPMVAKRWSVDLMALCTPSPWDGSPSLDDDDEKSWGVSFRLWQAISDTLGRVDASSPLLARPVINPRTMATTAAVNSQIVAAAVRQAQHNVKRLVDEVRQTSPLKRLQEDKRKRDQEAHRVRDAEVVRQRRVEARKMREDEARKKREEELRQQRAEEARRKREEELRKQREEEARAIREEELRKRREEETRLRLEAEARRLREEEARQKQQEEARKRQEEARKRQEEARKRQEEARKRQEEARKRAEEARKKREEEARIKKEEEERQYREQVEEAERLQALQDVKDMADREWQALRDTIVDDHVMFVECARSTAATWTDLMDKVGEAYQAHDTFLNAQGALKGCVSETEERLKAFSTAAGEAQAHLAAIADGDKFVIPGPGAEIIAAVAEYKAICRAISVLRQIESKGNGGDECAEIIVEYFAKRGDVEKRLKVLHEARTR